MHNQLNYVYFKVVKAMTIINTDNSTFVWSTIKPNAILTMNLWSIKIVSKYTENRLVLALRIAEEVASHVHSYR